MSMSTTAGTFRQRRNRDEESRGGLDSNLSTHGLADLPRHQLYDTPMPDSHGSDDATDGISLHTQASNQNIASPRPHNPTIRFEAGDVAHYYPSPGQSGPAVHEQRGASNSGIYPVQELRESPERHDSDMFDHSQIAPPSERFRSQQQGQMRKDSDPFRDSHMSSSQLTLLSTTNTEPPTPRDSEDDLRNSMSSPEDMRGGHPLLSGHHRRASSGRSYPSGNGSSDDEREARESLVGSSEGTPRHGGIRLLPSKPSGPRRI